MKQINTFRIVFFGETLSGHTPSDIREKMNRILKTGPDEIQALKSGQKAIVKDGLDLVSAVRYWRALKQAGVITQVQPMVDCPFCGHRQCADESCRRCGKLRASASSLISDSLAEQQTAASLFAPEQIKRSSAAEGRGTTEGEAEGVKKAEDPSKIKAHGMLRTAIIVMSSVVLIDAQLQNFMTLDIRWLYLIPLPFFILGCLHLARLKGYSGGWGGLGVSTLFGLGVLLLLPDRKHLGKREIKGFFFALALILIALFWAGEKISTWYDLRSLSQAIASREQAWRTLGPDMANYHLMGLRSFMDQAFRTAEKHELRPREKYRIAEMCLDGLGRFLFGIQNCRFRPVKKNRNTPFFNDKLLSLWKYDFIEYLRLKALELNDPYFLNCVSNWHFIKDYRGEFFSGENIKFIVNLHEYEALLRKAVSNFEKANGRLPGKPKDLAPILENEEFSSMAVIRFDSPNKLTLTLGTGAGKLNGETVQFGMPEGEKVPLDKKMVRIGGSLSERFRPDDSNYYVLKTMRDMKEFKSSDFLSQIKWTLMSILSGF